MQQCDSEDYQICGDDVMPALEIVIRFSALMQVESSSDRL